MDRLIFFRDVLKLSGLKPFKVLSVVPIKPRKNVLKGVGGWGGGVWEENSGKLRDVSEDSYLFSLISSVVIKIQ